MPSSNRGKPAASTFFDRLGALLYIFGAPAVFFPLGGLDGVREATLDALNLQRNSAVLELGCGAGALTAKLINRGATVTAVDQSEAMLRRARRRAPAATFVHSDVLDFRCNDKFDRVLLAFVLHHLAETDRISALTLARNALNPTGRVGILDWNEPPRGTLRWALHGLIALVEPASAIGWIEQGFDIHLERAGLSTVDSRTLARGAAKVVVARDASSIRGG